MPALAGPLHVVALVLVVSGLQKLVAPAPAARALRDAGLPLPRRLGVVPGVVVGAGEAATGLAAIAVPAAWAPAWLAVAYLALAGFVVLLLRRGDVASCGCFGSADTPPTRAHVVANAAAALVAAGATLAGGVDVVDVLDEGVGVALPYAALVATGAVLVLLAPTLLAGLRIDRSRPRTFGSVR